MAEVLKYRCPVPSCLKDVGTTQAGKFRKHNRGDSGEDCEMSGIFVPAHIVKAGPIRGKSDVPVKGRDYADCPSCSRIPIIDKNGNFGLHYTEQGGRERCELSGKPYVPPENSEPQTSKESIEQGEDIASWRERRNQSLGLTDTRKDSRPVSTVELPSEPDASESTPRLRMLATKATSRPGSMFRWALRIRNVPQRRGRTLRRML
jgi:hypothetical protein